ncbi:treslin-like [Macrobrachium rosenbergii]|uniref:treslin-like n=1 Tax=Macrobrachium rosenbergii TaxID=79674 RepID=UPI0034D3E47B
MFSSVQAVFLFDVNSFCGKCQSESELEQNVAKLKLGSLKLLTEFGAQTEKGIEGVRWSAKYYHSANYKPNTNRKSFVDFTRTSFEEFENAIADCFCDAFDNDSQPRIFSPNSSKSHCFILKKALQEIVLDYNWDGPDISSPVKKTTGRRSKTKNGILPENVGPYNTVVVFTNVPLTLGSVREFVGGSRTFADGSPKYPEVNDATAEDYLGSILDPATLKSFQDDKIHLSFVAVNPRHEISTDGPQGNKIFGTIHSGLGRVGGGLHLIENIVETSNLEVENHGKGPSKGIFPSQSPSAHSIRLRTPWWRKAKGSRPRRPQKGPTLVWEDAEGISNVQVELEVLAVHGSSSRGWGSASVVAVMQSASLSLLAMAGGTGHLYVCHAPNTVFTSIIQLLSKHQLSMLLKLSCGGIAVLSPWAGGVGSLAVVSASGLATPPVMYKSGAQDSKMKHPSILKFVTQAVEKCLKIAPAHASAEPEVTARRFAAHYTERWFKPLLACEGAVKKIVKTKTTKIERLAMQERLQKKYRPQIPRALATGEIERVDLVDITQPPTDPEPGVNTNPNMSRAQQLVKKSHIVTAQQKVKEQLAEEEERVQATERRAALASEQARKSQALESHILNTVSDPQNTEELKQSLIALRESSDGETDSYTTAQTIINLALTHIKSTGSITIESDLGKVLGDGVLQSAGEVNATYTADSRLSQYKLQTLFHLELLWLFGYSSSCMLDGEEQDSRGGNLREHHIGEAVKHLRAISLNHNPSTMASFLQETLLENYGETLGEVLVEIYEELNQPLPEELRILTGDVRSVYDTRPSSVRSLGSVIGPESNGTPDNPDSIKSREERRLTRHPTLMEPSKHRLVVPITNRTLKRNDSERTRVPSAARSKETADHEFQRVRRNLFDWTDSAPKSKLRRSHTVDGVPVAGLRRSPRKKIKQSVDTSPLRARGYKKTPVKEATASSKGLQTPKLKKSGVLAPETPGDKIGRTIFNRKRICKSTGTTVVTESPDIKRACRTTPRKLRASLTVTRRNSFYSGGRSRNWERAKTQLLADRIRGKSGQRNIDQNSLQHTSASQLFTEILSDVADNPRDDPKARLTRTPIRHTLNFGLDDTESEENERAPSYENQNLRLPISGNVQGDTPAKNTRSVEKARVQHNRSLRLESRMTPVKNVRRALSLSTPSKSFAQSNNDDDIVRSDVPQGKNASPNSASKPGVTSHFPETPKRFNTSLCEMTPSKRVQFSLTCTPNKVPVSNNFQTPRGKSRSLSETPITPRSILKTPKKSADETPSKQSFLSPDIFGSSKKGPRSPVTTPLKASFTSALARDLDALCDLSNRSTDSPFSGFSDKHVTVSQNTTPMKIDKSQNATPLKINKCQNATPIKTAKNQIASPIKVGNIACYEESEVELVSPLKNNHGSYKASLILHNTPTKRHQTGDVLDTKPCKLKFDKETDDCGDYVENSVNLDQEPFSGIGIPQMDPKDIEYLNNLMFGSDLDQNLNVSAEICESIDAELECANNIEFLSSPLKYGVESSGYVGSQSLVSLPDKQECLDDVDFKMIDKKDHQTSLSSSDAIEMSPESDDKTAPPSLNSILCQHMGDVAKDASDEEADIPAKSSENLDSCPSESMVPYKDELQLTGIDRSPSVSPEIPLDYKQLYHYLGKHSILEKENEDLKSPETSNEQESSVETSDEQNRTRSCSQNRSSNSRSIKRKLALDEENENEFEQIFKPIDSGAKVKAEVQSHVMKPDEEEIQIFGSEIKQGKSKSRRMRYASSTPINGDSQKRKISSSEGSGAGNQENKRKKKRPIRRCSRKKERRKSGRLCITKRKSLKEISSDDENFETYEASFHFKEKGRIFDDDSDFESPGKNLKLSCSKKLPLKNLENLCNRDAVTDSCTGDTEAYLSESSKDHSLAGTPKTPCRKGREQKIDRYLPPVQKRETNSVDTAQEHETDRKNKIRRPQIEKTIDWKRIKPRRSFVTDVKIVRSRRNTILNSSGNGNVGDKNAHNNGDLKTRKRKRKRGVKLKLTKSGGNYEVSNVDISLGSSDRNSSSADSHIISAETCDTKSPSNVSKSATPFNKKKKVNENHCMITPLRFTRHMSKDLSVSPELFSQLIALSPEKKSPKKGPEKESEAAVPPKKVVDNEIIRRRRALVRHFSGKRNVESTSNHPVQLKKDIITSEWTVQNIPGSPTMKTFIRKQKKKHAIHTSPRIELLPLEEYSFDQPLIKPSVMSLLHLSVSPIVSRKKTEATEQSPCDRARSRSLRRLHKGSVQNTD